MTTRSSPDSPDLDAAREELAAARQEYDELEEAQQRVRKRIADAIVQARRAGMRPTDINKISPYIAAWNRKILRDAGFPSARGSAAE